MRALHRSRLALLACCLLVRPAHAEQAPAGTDDTHLATFDAAWRLVRDSHFDPTLGGIDWQAVRDELAPRVAAATTPDEVRTIIRAMLARLNQSHFAILPGDRSAVGRGGDGTGTPGLDVRLLGAEMVVTQIDPAGAAAGAGIRPGWVVIAIDGHRVGDLLGHLSPELAPQLFAVEAWRLTAARLSGPPGSRVKLDLADGAGRTVSVEVLRGPEPGQPARIGSLPAIATRVTAQPVATASGGQVGLIGFNAWMPPINRPIEEAVDRFRGAAGIILDLRGNPGGLAAMVMGIAGHFLDRRVSLGTMRTREGDLQFLANPRRVGPSGAPVEPFAGPLAVLIDGLTGSASECLAGGLQALGRARVFGQRSMGQALPARFDKLPNGDILLHAYADFVTPLGVRLEGRGVIPDEVVTVTRESLIAGRDEPLEAALRWIDRTGRGSAPKP